jgi:transcriptional regulator with XRE-family HTH domain
MGDRLGELRRAKGLTQEALARIAGVGVDSLRKYESGTRTPLLDTAAKIATALGCTLGVLGGTEPMPEAPPAARKRKEK